MSQERESQKRGLPRAATTKPMNEIRIAPTVSGYSVRLQVRDAEVFKGLISSLKRIVPRFARRFDAVEGCWHVKVEAASDVEEWLSLAGKRYNVSVVWDPPGDTGGITSRIGLKPSVGQAEAPVRVGQCRRMLSHDDDDPTGDK